MERVSDMAFDISQCLVQGVKASTDGLKNVMAGTGFIDVLQQKSITGELNTNVPDTPVAVKMTDAVLQSLFSQGVAGITNKECVIQMNNQLVKLNKSDGFDSEVQVNEINGEDLEKIQICFLSDTENQQTVSDENVIVQDQHQTNDTYDNFSGRMVRSLENPQSIKCKSTEPVKCEVTELVKREGIEPVKCEVTEPVKREGIESVKREVTQPVKSESFQSDIIKDFKSKIGNLQDNNSSEKTINTDNTESDDKNMNTKVKITSTSDSDNITHQTQIGLATDSYFAYDQFQYNSYSAPDSSESAKVNIQSENEINTSLISTDINWSNPESANTKSNAEEKVTEPAVNRKTKIQLNIEDSLTSQSIQADMNAEFKVHTVSEDQIKQQEVHTNAEVKVQSVYSEDQIRPQAVQINTEAKVQFKSENQIKPQAVQANAEVKVQPESEDQIKPQEVQTKLQAEAVTTDTHANAEVKVQPQTENYVKPGAVHIKSDSMPEPHLQYDNENQNNAFTTQINVNADSESQIHYNPQNDIKAEEVQTSENMKAQKIQSDVVNNKFEFSQSDAQIRNNLNDNSKIYQNEKLQSDYKPYSDNNVSDTDNQMVYSSQVQNDDKSDEILANHNNRNLSPDNIQMHLRNNQKTVVSDNNNDRSSEHTDSGNDFIGMKMAGKSTDEVNKNPDSQLEELSDFESIMHNAVTLNSLDFARVSNISMEDTVMEKEISSQTFDALDDGIINDKKEFIIKLSPHGLGDITVKLIKSDDAVLVKMIASNEKTAQLLNRDIGILHNMLSSHNAEIQPVIYQRPDDNGSRYQFSQGFSYNQDFQKNQNQSQRHWHSGGQDYTADSNANEEPALTIMPSIIGNTILNRYI